jgi:hypothetical protein
LLNFILLLTFLFSLLSCSNSYKPTSYLWKLSSIYNPVKSDLHPAYKVYHNAANVSTLFFKVYTKELLFRETLVEGEKECSFTLQYMLQEVGLDSNVLADSNSYVFRFRKSDLNSYYITQIPIEAEEGKSYRLKLTLTDDFRNTYNISCLVYTYPSPRDLSTSRMQACG